MWRDALALSGGDVQPGAEHFELAAERWRDVVRVFLVAALADLIARSINRPKTGEIQPLESRRISSELENRCEGSG